MQINTEKWKSLIGKGLDTSAHDLEASVNQIRDSLDHLGFQRDREMIVKAINLLAQNHTALILAFLLSYRSYLAAEAALAAACMDEPQNSERCVSGKLLRLPEESGTRTTDSDDFGYMAWAVLDDSGQKTDLGEILEQYDGTRVRVRIERVAE